MKIEQLFEDRQEKTKLIEYINKVYSKARQRNPFGEGVIFNPKKKNDDAMVLLTLSPFDGRVHIKEIIVMEGKAGQGFGEPVMKLMTDLADKENIDLDLIPVPIEVDGKKIPKSKLISFYKKHGFVKERQNMVREAK